MRDLTCQPPALLKSINIISTSFKRLAVFLHGNRRNLTLSGKKK
jgi:hypothetical protein